MEIDFHTDILTYIVSGRPIHGLWNTEPCRRSVSAAFLWGTYPGSSRLRFPYKPFSPGTSWISCFLNVLPPGNCPVFVTDISHRPPDPFVYRLVPGPIRSTIFFIAQISVMYGLGKNISIPGLHLNNLSEIRFFWFIFQIYLHGYRYQVNIKQNGLSADRIVPVLLWGPFLLICTVQVNLKTIIYTVKNILLKSLL